MRDAALPAPERLFMSAPDPRGMDRDWESSLLGVPTRLFRGVSNALRLCRDQHRRKGDDPCRIAASCPSPQMPTPG
jgi:hypothetical protein